MSAFATEPTCNNCNGMAYRNDTHGEAHRYCVLFSNWIPDNEMFPCCDSHQLSTKGGAR